MSGKRGAGCRCDTRRIGGLENECSCFLSAAEDTRRIGGLEISHEAGGQFGYDTRRIGGLEILLSAARV